MFNGGRPLGLIHMLSRETEKALFYHPRPLSEQLRSEVRQLQIFILFLGFFAPHLFRLPLTFFFQIVIFNYLLQVDCFCRTCLTW